MANPVFESFIDNLVPPEEIQRHVNEHFDALFASDKNGDLRPFVCCVCNELILENCDKCQMTIQKMKAAEKALS